MRAEENLPSERLNLEWIHWGLAAFERLICNFKSVYADVFYPEFLRSILCSLWLVDFYPDSLANLDDRSMELTLRGQVQLCDLMALLTWEITTFYQGNNIVFTSPQRTKISVSLNTFILWFYIEWGFLSLSYAYIKSKKERNPNHLGIFKAVIAHRLDLCVRNFKSLPRLTIWSCSFSLYTSPCLLGEVISP